MGVAVKIDGDAFARAKKFSLDVSKSQQAFEFGNRKTAHRSRRDIARDTLVGKLAELGVEKFFDYQFGVKTEVRFDVFGDEKIGDKADLVLNGKLIEIKSTRYGHWLLVEKDKLMGRIMRGETPFAFIFVLTGWDRLKDRFTGSVELVGFCTLDTLLNSQLLTVGSYLPNTNVRLQATNYAVHASNLSEDWEKLV